MNANISLNEVWPQRWPFNLKIHFFWLIKETNAAEHYERTKMKLELYKDDLEFTNTTMELYKDDIGLVQRQY